jgi:hypothetical protein
MISTERTLSSFEEIHIAGSMMNVRFHASEEYRAVVTIDSNLKEYVILNITNKVLNIDLKDGYSYSLTDFTVDIYCPSMSGISILGSGHFEAVDKIITETFKAGITGSGQIEGKIECNHLSARITGAGEIKIKGIGKTVNVDISGSGDFHGMEFQHNKATVRVSGSGNVAIWTAEYLDAKISGSGSIKYRGNPKIDYSCSGSGRLLRLQPKNN